MKKISVLVSMAMIIAVISCSNQPAEVKKEIIVMPAAVEKKEPIIIVDTPKTTSVTLDKNGVQVETKKVKVKVNPN